MIEIREATEDDLPDITRIYNDAVLGTVATFDIEEKSAGEMAAWLEAHRGRLPVLVCIADAAVAGFASLGEYSPKKAYSATAEVSVYIDSSKKRRGYGRALLGAAIEAATEVGVHSLVARITADNDISARLFESFDFRHVGRLREVGRKFGRLLDVDIYQRTIEETGREA